MISIDIDSGTRNFIDKTDYDKLLNRKEEVLSKFRDAYMTGWTKRISSLEVDKIISVAQEVKKHSQCLVVIGIGGSFLGSYAVKTMLGSYFREDFKIIYAGTTLSSEYMKELLEYLDDVDFSVNVISKSGTTMETMITYNLIKEKMLEKYSEAEIKKRIIITTDKEKGILREEVNKYSYTSFEIPDDIGGRYSIMTPAHLFPLAFNIDIKKFIEGYYDGSNYIDEAYKYASIRKCLFDKGKVVENFVVYEEKMAAFLEWLKQLFGETEGKNGVGLLPTSTVHTRDLHSLGQFVQEGNKILFETFIKVNSSAVVMYNNRSLHDINNIVLSSVRKAHLSGGVPSVCISIDEVSLEEVGRLMYFSMCSAAFSGYLFDIDPFNQPGVEVYKKEVRENLGVM